MRALLLTPDEINETELVIAGDRFRHLIQVCRMKMGDEVLLLDGKGHRAQGVITAIQKREGTLELQDLETLENPHTVDALIGCPKKDAVEEIIRRGVELGLRKIIFYESEFSTWKYNPHPRFDKIVESALIQSNNFWAPEVSWCPKAELQSVLAGYERALWLHPYLEAFTKRPAENKVSKVDLLCIGPEAGWSEEECEVIAQSVGIQALCLSTPILRAEHALSVAMGYALSLNDN